MMNMNLENMYFDEPFFRNGGGYDNYVGGEKNPKNKCKGGDVEGRIESMTISGIVAGKKLSKAFFDSAARLCFIHLLVWWRLDP